MGTSRFREGDLPEAATSAAPDELPAEPPPPFPFTGSASCNFSALLPLTEHTPSASTMTVLLFMATASSPMATTLPAAAVGTAGLAMATPPGRIASELAPHTNLIPVGESKVALPVLSRQTVAPPAVMVMVPAESIVTLVFLNVMLVAP